MLEGQLNPEIKGLLDKQAKQVQEVSEMESDYEVFMQEYNKVEEALNEKHRVVKDVYERFKTLLDDVKKKEAMKLELEKIQETIASYTDSIKKCEEQLKNLGAINNKIDLSVFDLAASLPDSVKSLLYRFRRRSQAKHRDVPSYRGKNLLIS